MLDLGTGSGILAIAAAKLGARHVLALDVDTVAVRVAAENVARNGVEDRVEVCHGTLPLQVAQAAHGQTPTSPRSLPDRDRTFDLVVANISLRALQSLHPVIRRVLRPGGAAFLSGVLESDSGMFLDDLDAAGWQLIDQRNEAEWSLLVVAPLAC